MDKVQQLAVVLAWVYSMIPQLENRASTKVKPVDSFGPAPSGKFNLNKWQLFVMCTRLKARAAAIAGLLHQFLGLKSCSGAELRFWGLVHAQPLDWRRGGCLSKIGFLEPFPAESRAKSHRKSSTSHTAFCSVHKSNSSCWNTVTSAERKEDQHDGTASVRDSPGPT